MHRRGRWSTTTPTGRTTTRRTRPATGPAFAGWQAQRALADQAVRPDGSHTALRALADRPVLAIAGIAHPARFFSMLRTAGLTRVVEQPLPDHHDFEDWAPPPGSPDTWLCTEKDAVKLWQRHPLAWAVPLQLQLPPDLLQALDRLLAARVPSQPLPAVPPAHGQQAP